MKLEPLKTDEWYQLAATRRPLPFFYLPEAYQAQETLSPRYQARAYRVETSEGTYLLPLLESRRWSLRLWYSGPDGTYGGLLPVGATPPASEALYRRVYRHITGLTAPCWFLTLPHLSALGLQPLGEAQDHTYRLHLGSSFEHFFQGVLTAKRRNIYRRGLRAGLRALAGREHLAAFLHLYATRTWVRTYPPLYWQSLLNTGRARLWVAEHQGRPVAALWLLVGLDEAFYYLGVAHPETQELSPLTFLLVEALRGLLQEGIQEVDLGTSMGLSGVEHFKRSFGARPVPVQHLAWCRLRGLPALRRWMHRRL